MQVQTGCNVKELLCNQLGINEDYLTQRIKSIFLNGKVVDDVTTAIVEENATLALSGAMPGLVGAILRSGESYAPMRSQISYALNSAAPEAVTGRINLKLWNMVAKEIGPVFLQQGVWIEAEELHSFLARHLEELKRGCRSADLAGNPVAPERLADHAWKADPLFLQVIPNTGS